VTSELERPSRTTLAAVARVAGVSTPTVSKVINGRDDVAPDTRRRVQKALLQIGYQSPSQRRAVTGGPVLVDLVLDGMTAYIIEVMRGIISYASQVNVEIVVSEVPSYTLRARNREEWADRLTETGRRGLILVVEEVTAVQTQAFRARGIPVVVIDPMGPPQRGVVSVGATNWAGGKTATDHLIGLGHERIAFIGGPENAECSQARLHGYLASMMASGMPIVPEYLTQGGFDTETGVRSIEHFFSLGIPPTAIFASSDAAASGALDAATRRGIRVPQDLSIVGFDDTYLASQSIPKLTTVAQPLQEMGRTALRTVMRLLAGETLDSDHVELATRLVKRESTARVATEASLAG
jgi:LacI family transcriptional regulator